MKIVETNGEQGKRAGGRPKTGTVAKTRDGRWQPIITLADGTRYRGDPLPLGTSKPGAKKRAAELANPAWAAGVRSRALPSRRNALTGSAASRSRR